MQIGRYRVLQPLGEGGMGQVYLAEDPALERKVALKLLHVDPTSSSLREEAKALAALHHPGIVTIFEIGEHEGRDFIAMEYVPGKTLREILNARTSNRDALISICTKVAIAVAAAHRAGILHRDIKPENILVGTDVKVLDFGIARRLEHEQPRRPGTARELVETLTATLTIVFGTATEVSAGTQTSFGTPAYMALEILKGEASTTASDVYSLGVVLYECLAHARPYAANSLMEMIAQMIDGEPTKLDDPLGSLVHAMLARDPSARPTFDVVIERLCERPPDATQPRRRSKAPLFAALAVIAIGGAVAVWQLREKREPSALPDAQSPRELVTLAIAPIEFPVLAYGGERSDADSLAELLATQFDEVSHGPVKARATANTLVAAREVEASQLVSITVADAGARVKATIVLTDVYTSQRTELPVIDADATSLATLLDEVTARIANHVAPGATLERAPNRGRAQKLYKVGKERLDEGKFRLARPYLEQAVDADSTFVDAWYSYALTLGWLEAPDALVQQAMARARELAPPGPQHELIRGMGLFLEGRYAEAREVVLPLDQPGVTASAELLYLLGEASWHDGRHDEANALFERTRQQYKKFQPAAFHMSQYALARRKIEDARYIIGITGEDTDLLELAAGNYEHLVDRGTFQVHARLVLGRPLTPALEANLGDGIDAGAFKIARALEAGDRAAARRLFAEIWPKVVDDSMPKGADAAVESLGEVVVAGELEDEARQLVTLLAERSQVHPRRGYHRIAILTAALASDVSLIPKDRLTYRETALAEVATAQIAGKRARAAEKLDELVRDPTFAFDFPERVMLLRHLIALRKKPAALALCKDTLRPPQVHYAYLVIRRACIQLGVKP